MAEGGSDGQLVPGIVDMTTDYYLTFCPVHKSFHQVWFRVYPDGTAEHVDTDA